MTSRERVLAAWNGQSSDYVPLTTWCFGLPAPPHLRWKKNTEDVTYWYSMRMEHLHTLPVQWELDDDFHRVLAWQSMGVDDILDVSVPWSADPEVTWQDTATSADSTNTCPVMTREYRTPSGTLRHSVRQTGEDPGDGWTVQPDHVPLIEDYNIPRAVEHAVSGPGDVAAARHLFKAPDSRASEQFQQRMQQVKEFADANGIAVQAWSAFGMDGVVWLAGTEGAIMLAVDHPEAFDELLEMITEADLGRTELAASNPGVDMVVERGWYSSTDFWSPRLFDKFLQPRIEKLSAVAHKHGKKFGYVMTTGVETLGPRLADAGVDVLYFVDPVQDRVDLMQMRRLLGDRMTLVGGTNALSLSSGDPNRIRDEVKRAIDILGPTKRFILHPVDAIFPDTPWEGIEALIDAWNDFK